MKALHFSTVPFAATFLLDLGFEFKGMEIDKWQHPAVRSWRARLVPGVIDDPCIVLITLRGEKLW